MTTFQNLARSTKIRKKRRKNVFEQFGFVAKEESDNHLIGNCPFCGKNDHFFINIESVNKTWDCKKCLREGGFKSFVQQMRDYCKEHTSDQVLRLLQENRNDSISIETLRERVGFHPLTQQYILPYTNNKNEVINLKLYNFHLMISAAEFAIDLYGLWDLDNIINSDQIFICEGEWDWMYWHDCLKQLGITIPIVAVPGAGSFKENNLTLFQGKSVYLLFDNDNAGRKGVQRTTKMLNGIADTVYKLDWPDTLDDGFDIRDLRSQGEMNAEESYNYVLDRLVESTLPEDKNQITPGEINSRLCPLEPIVYNEVFSVYQEYLHMPDPSMLYVVFGTILAGRLTDDPLWMLIVAPPGATKTETLLSLSDTWCVEVLSTLTPHTLISGSNKSSADPSLIPKLNGKVLVVKDFTTIMSLPSAEREEIIGILRDAYDGECSKPFGNGVFRKYKSKFSILAAATPAIESFVESHAAMGERFLRWRNYLPTSMYKRKVYVDKAMDNVGKGQEIKAGLADAAKQILLADYSNFQPTIPLPIKDKIASLSLMVAQLRTVINRDVYSKEIIDIPEAELATRLSKQFTKLILSIGTLRMVKEIGLYEYNIAKQVAKSSMPYRIFVIFNFVVKSGTKGILAKEISEQVSLSSSIVHMLLENLVVLNLIVKEQIIGESIKKFTYKVHPDVKHFAEDSSLF